MISKELSICYLYLDLYQVDETIPTKPNHYYKLVLLDAAQWPCSTVCCPLNTIIIINYMIRLKTR